MHPKEVAKHNARRQLLKVLEHVREARQKLSLAYEHLYLVAGVTDCKVKCLEFRVSVDELYTKLGQVHNKGIQLSHTLKEQMENPDDRPPPMLGQFLRYRDLTPLQRHLVREGHEEIAEYSRDRIPPTYHENLPPPKTPPKILTDLNAPKPKPNRRKLIDDMPL